MDHTCHRCHAVIAEGAPFCAQCGAPQIRVNAESVTPSDSQSTPAAPYDPARARGVDWKHGFFAAFKAGAIMGIATGLPLLSLFCCLWVPAGGAMCVWFYVKGKTMARAVSAGAGARLGVMAGVFGFLIWVPTYYVSLLLAHVDLRKEMMESLAKSAEMTPTPQAQEIIRWAGTSEGMTALILITLFMFFLGFVLFGAIGGALGSRFSSKSE